jgi:hypothetical protein
MFGSLRVKLAVATLVLLALGAFGAAWYVRSRLARPYQQSLQTRSRASAARSRSTSTSLSCATRAS